MTIFRFLNLTLIGFLLMTVHAASADKTIDLAVKNMTCVSCPYMVTKALQKVDGVKTVKVSLADKLAKVTYDDTQTNVEAMIDATFEAGFPSSLKRTKK